jgi:hypothetical protein
LQKKINAEGSLPPARSSSALKFQQNTLILLTSPARGRFSPDIISHKKDKKFANF